MNFSKQNIVVKCPSILRSTGACVIACCISTSFCFAQILPRCNFHLSANSSSEGRTRAIQQDELLYIPVVFHIVYSDASQNLPDEQIYSQLDVINEDFNRMNSDSINTKEEFKQVAGKVRIQFYLAEVQQGITRTATTHGPFYNDDLHISSKGGRDGEDSKKYLNVWVANLAPGIFGYGSSPGTEAFKDGVAIHYEYFGRHKNAKVPYNLGRTLTHEIGHWLGLQHPWGLGGCDSDDGVSDTPVQEAPTSSCLLSQMSCGSLDMVQNFMNTSDDACMNLFTKQQTQVMRNTLANLRPGAFNTTGIVTGVNESTVNSDMIVYPNPITDVPVTHMSLNNSKNDKAQVLLTDMLGRKIQEYEMNAGVNQIDLDLTGLQNGVYIAKANTQAGSASTKIFLSIR